MWLVFVLLYAPIIVLVVFSFNRAGDVNNYSQFSFYWYGELFRDARAFSSLKNSLFLAVTSSLLATVIGTLAAFGIDRMRKKHLRGAVMSVTNIPMMNPDIVTGVSMMLLFVMYQGFAGKVQALPDSVFGLPTLLIAHITFNVPYVVFNVAPKLRQMDMRLYEAALDLGCNPTQAFFKVVLPELSPAILSAFLICLTYSIDDFIISYFNCGTLQTLPIAIYSMTRKKVSPEINALSTIMFLVILAIILISNAWDTRRRKHR